jgi:hypothetical protein
MHKLYAVIPAQTGIQGATLLWIPAFAGMTHSVAGSGCKIEPAQERIIACSLFPIERSRDLW